MSALRLMRFDILVPDPYVQQHSKRDNFAVSPNRLGRPDAMVFDSRRQSLSLCSRVPRRISGATSLSSLSR
jgi:hypothetical protein